MALQSLARPASGRRTFTARAAQYDADNLKAARIILDNPNSTGLSLDWARRVVARLEGRAFETDPDGQGLMFGGSDAA